MSERQLDAASVARRLADSLEARGVPYAIGGAIAYGYFGAARGTKDVDLNIFLSPDEARPALDRLDRSEIRRWLVDGVGEDDERVRRWDELCQALSSHSEHD